MPMLACDRPVNHPDEQAAETSPEVEDEPDTGICGAADAIDDACEDVHGEDAEPCAPFDQVDDGCEEGKITEADACEQLGPLREACSAMFGSDAQACSSLNEVALTCPSSPPAAGQGGEPEYPGRLGGDAGVVQ